MQATFHSPVPTWIYCLAVPVVIICFATVVSGQPSQAPVVEEDVFGWHDRQGGDEHLETVVSIRNQDISQKLLQSLMLIPELAEIRFVKCTGNWQNLRDLADSGVVKISFVDCDLVDEDLRAIALLNQLKCFEIRSGGSKVTENGIALLGKCKGLTEVTVPSRLSRQAHKLKDQLMREIKVNTWTKGKGFLLID